MAFLQSVIGSFRLLSRDRDDDFIDRLHYDITSGMLVALAALVSFKQFGGKPVECMVPDTFTSAWEEFAEMHCFAKNTYFLPFNQLVPQKNDERVVREISYYQWVPFVLLFEAACFQLPFLIWRLLATHSGIKIHEVVRQAKDPKNLKSETRLEALRTVRIHLENALKFHRRLYRRNIMPHELMRCLNLPYTSAYVTTMYLVVKVLYLANAIGQFLLLNTFLNTGTDYKWMGWGAFLDVLRGEEWEDSGYFPRVTLCDIRMRTMGNVQPVTMQCVLVINILNEKIFVFLYFWFQVLVICTSASFIYWVLILLFPCFSIRYIKRHLELADLPITFTEDSNKDVNRFIQSYLHLDGVFVLRMIEMHSGIIFASDLTCALWGSFYGIEDICCDREMRTSQIIVDPVKPVREQFRFSRPKINPTAPSLLGLSDDPKEQKKMENFFYRRDPSRIDVTRYPRLIPTTIGNANINESPQIRPHTAAIPISSDYADNPLMTHIDQTGFKFPAAPLTRSADEIPRNYNNNNHNNHHPVRPQFSVDRRSGHSTNGGSNNIDENNSPAIVQNLVNEQHTQLRQHPFHHQQHQLHRHDQLHHEPTLSEEEEDEHQNGRDLRV